ncbi:aspartate/glutamate racemase family protein [Tranquillimonas alkanivorans]|uniref:Arylmalonate decarboxylase n=1 Tax=Tranquillimonas alkanivorans TaxID=441119 RepID=A0A1I5UC90_9RHOB|nr:aspartate/glutamate racemase family protein [Tranquillimonas alkanivorans]SFP92923.1 arylmalonate decarboxylase [Tranquillimonas alkanivorans]
MQPVIGMIVPPAAGKVPPEAYGLFPEGITFAARGLALRELSLNGYSEVIDRVADLVRDLREVEGADAVSLMGTSLSFFKGNAFNDELVQVMERSGGIPATTMSNAIRDALRTLGAHRIAVGTAYTDEVNERLRVYLETAGFEIVSLQGLGLTEVPDVHAVTQEEVVELGQRAAESAVISPDAVLVSCGGLIATDLAPQLEARIGLPVVASATAGVWASVRLLGRDGASPKLGMLAEASRSRG